VAAGRVTLYRHGGDIAVISEYDGEARLVQPALELDASLYGVVFVCEPGHDAGALTAAARGGDVVDLRLRSATTERKRSSPRSASGHPPAPALLATLDQALGLVAPRRSFFARGGFRRARARGVTRADGAPVAFRSTPTDVFGRQLAFSAVPAPISRTKRDERAHRRRDAGARARA
jgi:hypothetical protein